ncbi:CoA-binding protein [Iamia majanohamensis]|uniref:CoA-binding protein n=1 Tax=Iamia majanohamensis TaxID=467976 RepID=A0AAE9Y8Q2_9ACTN|nr:CoA-binding protein [Iamia majanohamensis]WCO66553.1 CoA-binding protein [Iamia majanohamensis]
METLTITPASVDGFLAGHRLAVVGASDESSSFGRTIVEALADHGYDVVAVHPTSGPVAGQPCHRTLADVPGDLDGVVVMTSAEAATEVVRDCLDLGVDHVWLFKGLGGPGALSDDAVRLCREHDIDVVAGACPLMFLEPVGWFHKVHRAARHLRGDVARS